MILEYEYARLMTEAILEPDDRIRDLRTQGTKRIFEIVHGYQKQRFNKDLLLQVLRKKGNMILNASTSKEVEEIIKPSQPRYVGGKIVPKTEYYVEEEELILWSMTSLYGKLIPEGNERYMELFQSIHPEAII